MKKILKSGIKKFFPSLFDSIKIYTAAQNLIQGKNLNWSNAVLDDVVLANVIRTSLANSAGIGIDIGASDGTFTSIMVESAPQEPHLAVDARLSAIELLKKKYQHTPLKVIHCCLSDKVENIEFNIAVDDYGYSGMRQTDAAKNISKFQTVRMQAQPLDEILSGNTRPVKIIKIDVEGAELKVLAGAEKTIRTHQPLLAFECGNHLSTYQTQSTEVFDFLHNLGYAIRSSLQHSGNALPLSRSMFEEMHARGDAFFFFATPNPRN